MGELIKRWQTKRLLGKIAKADDEQLESIIRYILHSYKKDYPETECIFLCLPRKDWEERRRILASVCNILMKQKTDSLE